MAVCYTNDMEDLVLLCERIDCGSLYTYLYQKVSLQPEAVINTHMAPLQYFDSVNRMRSRDATEFEFKSECCRIPTIFCKSEIRWIFRLIWIRIQLSFWKAQVHHSS